MVVQGIVVKKVAQEAVKAFTLLLERARRANARLAKYSQPVAALPTVEEYRKGDSQTRRSITNDLKRFVDNTPSDYNLRRAKEVREQEGKQGTRPAERTAQREAQKVTENTINRRSGERDDEFRGYFNLALRRFSVKLATYNVWKTYVNALLDIFMRVKENFGVVFANVFGKKIIDNWLTFENAGWRYESDGQGASIGYFKAMDFLNVFAQETEQEYNQSVVNSARKKGTYQTSMYE